jgi:hypothetical protein
MPIAHGVANSAARVAATSVAHSNAAVDERIGLERFPQRFSL